MPELPEVETVVRGLRGPLVGRTITSFWNDWPRTIGAPDPDSFAARVVGQTVQSIDRRAKYIVCTLDHDLLIVHLKMTGRLYVARPDVAHEADRWVHVKLGLSDGNELRFSDSRKFGKVFLTGEFASITPGAAALGPEPLDGAFTADVFRARMKGRSTALKALLLDQSFVAGVGNIYADEALFRAKLHPLRRADTLTKAEAAALHATVQAVLREGIDYEGASVNWYRKPDGTTGEAHEHFYAYGRDGEPCLVCGTPLRKIRVAQRGTHYCPTCQPEKRPRKRRAAR
ncbi:MAG: bifunctional DNA-formamidopyrimidine glycosylase/DNA-(apurinic or apyrimidinic site) lyase [Chloroflexi bacterium]|nr:bifunctional DNA-formamidopyrimidine glycosylase/DNA-(apurinic or apyrimidinic site) lyase [Chloroflexota bacterium]